MGVFSAEIVEVRWVQMLDARCTQTLDRREHMVEGRRAPTPDPKLAERMVAQRVPERRKALRQNLLAVGNGQEAAPRESGP